MIVVKSALNAALVQKFHGQNKLSQKADFKGSLTSRFEQQRTFGEIVAIANAFTILPCNVAIVVTAGGTSGEIELAEPALTEIVQQAIKEMSFLARRFREKHPMSSFHLTYSQIVTPKV